MIQADDNSFKEIVQDSGKYTFVDFYADWCRHCAKLAPVLENVAGLFDEDSGVQLVKVNGDKDGKRLSRKYVLQGYPTMLMFHGDDDPVEYDGGRDETLIGNFIQQMAKVRVPGANGEAEGSISKLIQVSDDNIQADVLDSAAKSVVLFTSSRCKSCNRIRADFENLANWYHSDRDIVQFVEINLDSNCRKIKEQFSIWAAPVVLLFDPKHVDEEGLKSPQLYSGRFDIGSLNSYVNKVTGIPRNKDGSLEDDAGVLPHLRDHVRALSTLDDKVNAGMLLLSEINAITAGESPVYTRMLPYYRHLTDQVMNGNFALFPQELSRLEAILEDSDTLQEGAELMANVLREFLW